MLNKIFKKRLTLVLISDETDKKTKIRFSKKETALIRELALQSGLSDHDLITKAFDSLIKDLKKNQNKNELY